MNGKRALRISANVSIPENEIEFKAVRARGPGGQNVNMVATAIHLRFDIMKSSLPDFYKQQLINLQDSRINSEGIIVIKARQFRSQAKNRADALKRLQSLIKNAARIRKKRKKTRPTKASGKRRLNDKSRTGKLKKLRGKVIE